MPVKSTQHLSFKDRANIENLDKYIRSSYFRHPFSPGSFTGNAYFNQMSATVDSSFVLFLDSEAKGIIYTFPRPALWINGYFTVTLFHGYSSSSGPKVFDVEVLANDISTDPFGSAISLASYSVTTTSPTANRIYQNNQEETTNPIISDYELVSVKIDHDGTADAGTANMRFFGGYLTYHPINPQ